MKMFCSKCGNQVRSDAAFCDKCGNQIQAQEPPDSRSALPPYKPTSCSMWLLIGVCTLVGLWIFGRSYVSIPATQGNSGTSGGGGYAVYRITGTASNVSLTFENVNGDGSQIDRAEVPWNYDFQASRGQFLYVSAQNNGEFGDVTCEIVYNNQVIAKSTSSGAYVIASCSDTAR